MIQFMKIAVVTGASSGIGREFVRQIGLLYKNLDEIWVIARRKDRMLELQKECPYALRIFAGDLLKKQVFKEYHKAINEYHPDVRLLVNAAGFGKSGTFTEIAESGKKIQTDMIDLNCRSLTRMTQMTLPHMSKGSRIVNIASAAAFCPQAGFSVYAATKSYVLSFSRSLEYELKNYGISVTAVCPGPVDTEFFNICGELSSPIKKMTLASPKSVVHKALNDCRKRKSISIYGFPMKFAAIGSKLFPHSLILKIEGKLTK